MGLIDLIGAAGAVLTGGASGLIGAAISNIFKAWENKQALDAKREEWAHEREMKKIDGELMAQEWAQRAKVAAIEGQTAESVADAGAFAKSFQLEPQSYSAGMKPPEGGAWAKAAQGVGWLIMVALDAIRGIVRPGLTLYLCWITTQMYEQNRAALALLDGSSDKDAMVAVYAAIVNTVLYLFTTCLLWWFGTRNKQEQPKPIRAR